MMGSLGDNFYSGHSLAHMNRTENDEKLIVKNSLKKAKLNPNDDIIKISLETKRQIYRHIRKNCNSEIKKIQIFEKKNAITGSSIPIDVYMAQQVFDFLLDNKEVLYLAASALLPKLKKIAILKLKEKKTSNIYDENVHEIVTKILKKSTDKVIIKNILEIQVKGKSLKKQTKKTKKGKSVKKQTKKRKT